MKLEILVLISEMIILWKGVLFLIGYFSIYLVLFSGGCELFYPNAVRSSTSELLFKSIKRDKAQ